MNNKNSQLKPWYAVATPHEDIRAGRLEEAVFAANIWAVVQGTAPDVYLDPEEFFRKTYMTVGLGTVLSRVSGALSGGESGDRIISLQTAFGVKALGSHLHMSLNLGWCVINKKSWLISLAKPSVSSKRKRRNNTANTALATWF